MWFQRCVEFDTPGRSTVDITGSVQEIVGTSGVATGLAHVFLMHTSASLMLCENADPDVRRDLEAFMQRLVPDGDRLYRHTAEGDDDMPAHVRTVLTHSGLAVPVSAGSLALGTWQGIYVWEHRHAPHRRRATITVQGE